MESIVVVDGICSADAPKIATKGKGCADGGSSECVFAGGRQVYYAVNPAWHSLYETNCKNAFSGVYKIF